MTLPGRTLQDLAKQAIEIQEAPNLGGLCRGFGQEVIPRLQELVGNQNLPGHPIVQLWVCQLYTLCGMALFCDTDKYHKAYDACKKLADGAVL